MKCGIVRFSKMNPARLDAAYYLGDRRVLELDVPAAEANLRKAEARLARAVAARDAERARVAALIEGGAVVSGNKP